MQSRNVIQALGFSAILLATSYLVTHVVAGPRAGRETSRIISPPLQPTTGPGSSDYPHASFSGLKLGSGATEYYLFEPADPKPATAPVIVFFHGFGVPNPQNYMAWITHMVRKGHSVICPFYQTDNAPPASAYVDNAIMAIRDGFGALSLRDHVRPELDHVAFVAHSLGSVIESNVASRAVTEGLPVPRCILLTHAADSGDGPKGTFDSLLAAADYSTIDGGTQLLAVVSTDDRYVYDEASHYILNGATRVPLINKQIVSISSDHHGVPPLPAGHDAPSNWTHSNALDFYGYWKWTDGLLDCAFYGANCEYAFGDTTELTFMGLWSDGVPVIPAEVIGP
ncbi:MAG: hypothetical protein HY287_06945 [Planctomycetes bacterium]|nr:hypothetical protein [Planctomycetota bacterium]MBI3834051.1 hypothetical protein [Planctomycetota bacterium]